MPSFLGGDGRPEWDSCLRIWQVKQDPEIGALSSLPLSLSLSSSFLYFIPHDSFLLEFREQVFLSTRPALDDLTDCGKGLEIEKLRGVLLHSCERPSP